MIDLHVHTTASDGTFTPREVVRLAARKAIKALAITDHDSVAGVQEAREEGASLGVEIIPGVELSVEWPHGILHVLGYFLNTDHPDLLRVLGDLKRIREERTPRILSRLEELQIHVALEEVESEAGGGVPGRLHLARILVRKGYVSNIQEAFDRYLRNGAAAYVRKPKILPSDAFRLIVESGGLPVLAHPYSLLDRQDVRLEGILEQLKALGLAGMEVYCPKHTADQTIHFLALARAYGLAVTGGTDFHGANKPGIELGVIEGMDALPYSMLEELKALRSSHVRVQ